MSTRAALVPEVESRTGTGESRRMLFVLPAVVGLVFLGWVIWRSTADLDSIEQRQLAWTMVGRLIWQHVQLTVVSTFFVLLVALPLGIALTRPRLRKAAPVVVAIANAGQAAPSIGLIVLLAIALQFGFWTGILSLTLYAILPVLRNTIVGLEGVDPTLVEAGRGVGMSSRAVLFRIELPLAVPVIMSGVRTALILLVGTATLATFIDAGGLGNLIVTGINLFRYSILVSGALLVALLALLVDWAGRVLEQFARPKGI
jgi:osmoprotectant transport system permease protein